MLLASCFCQAQVSPNIIKVEYWVDGDPGFDAATNITGFTPDSVLQNIVSNNILSLNSGMHTFGVRSKDANGVWGLTNHVPFLITDTTIVSTIASIEYFWDGDGGFGTGTLQGYIHTLPFATSDTSNYLDSVPVPNFGATPSYHILFARTIDSHNRFSHTNYLDTVHVTGTVNVIELNEQFGINIYPNPFADEITVTPKDNQKMRFIMYNESGQLVLDKVIIQSTQINMATFASGAYTVFIWSEKQKIYRSTLIKQ